MEPSAASTTSRPSECPQSPEIQRCEREIADAENALRAGHRDVAGLCLALSDWSAERRILRKRTPPGLTRRTSITKGILMAGGKRTGPGRKTVNIDLEEVEKLAATPMHRGGDRFLPRRERAHHRAAEEPARLCRSHGARQGPRDASRCAATCGPWPNKGQPAANIFLAKNLLGYKDYFSNEHSGPDGGPIVIGPAPELGELTNDELKQLSLLVAKPNARAKVERELATRNLREFVRQAWRVIEPRRRSFPAGISTRSSSIWRP